MPSDYRDLMAEAARAAGINPPAIVLPADHEVVVNGLRLHYLDWGNPHLPHVLLLHGGGLTAHTWDMAALLLRDRYHLLALDARGHGDSDWSPDGHYGWEQHVDDVAGLVAALGLRDFALVGMSMGGIIAMRFTARHPEGVRALVIVDVGPETLAEGRAELARFRAETQEEADSPEWFLERAVRFNPHRPVAHLRYSLSHSLKRLPSGKWTWKQDRRRPPEDAGDRERDEAARRALAEALWHDLAAITCPALVLRGARSTILSAEVARRTAAALPHGELVEIPNAGHTVQGDNPAAFAAALDTFLARVPPAWVAGRSRRGGGGRPRSAREARGAGT
jgi:esterase